MEEELLFLCYTCNKKTVCVECISNGIHKAHEVKNIKKAKNDIKFYIQQDLTKLRTKIETYESDQEKLEIKKNELIETGYDF